MMSTELSTTRAAASVVAVDVPFKVWQCVLCGFTYDEALGLPSDGIPPGTHWADVPESWVCPDCSAQKSDFEMVEL